MVKCKWIVEREYLNYFKGIFIYLFMSEINLMARYPKSNRNKDLFQRISEKTETNRKIARMFEKEFFDGDRKYGYGGYSYNSKYFTGVVEDMRDYYGLTSESKVLDIGCAKGFMLFDFKKIIPGITIRGIDISNYAIENAIPEIKEYVNVGNVKNLSEFKDKEYDLVTAITTVHNLNLEDCKQALREIERVGKNAFITVDAWKNEKEKERMYAWNLTALTYMHVDDWKALFDEVSYTGDYYWFTP